MHPLQLLRRAIKNNPEDFQVEEVVDLIFDDSGEYSYYLLKKRNINTILVLDLIQRYWKVSRDKIGFCGLKDKRAVTIQYISIKNGPEKDLTGPNFILKFLGKGKTPLKLGEAKGNVFTIILRGVNSYKMMNSLKLLREIGFANYFGEQRFAPDLYTKKPLVKYFLQNDYEGALKEYFTQHPKKSKTLKKLWGEWEKFLKTASHLSAVEKRVLLTYIKKGDPVKAFKVFPKHLKLLFFFSYQSLLWNRVLSRAIKRLDEKSICIRFVRKEQLCFYRDEVIIPKVFSDFELPFISPEIMDQELPSVFREEVDRVIEEERLTDFLESKALGLKIFNPGKRKVCVKPEDLKVVNVTKHTFTLRFFLPSGSYATIFLLKLLLLSQRF